MRRTTMFVCATAHLPEGERTQIDALIDDAERRADGRLVVDHPTLAIEPHSLGFFVATAVTGLAERPRSISPVLWDLLGIAHRIGAEWVLFDHEETPNPYLPVF